MIKENVQKILQELPANVQLVAAAKTRNAEQIERAIAAGVKIIGENYVQEAQSAFRIIGNRVKWHFIGHLQRKKVKQVVITGVLTHLCCETTARSAFMRGFEVFFTIDATATYNKDFHISTLLNLSHGFALPVLTQEVLHLLNGEEHEQ